MRRTLFCAALSLFFGLSLSAQSPGPIAKIYLIKVKPGMGQKFEEAYKTHLDWHREQKDSWVWEMWQYETGPRAGQYVVVTPGHKWSDFDDRGEMGKADGEHAEKTLLPLVDSLEPFFSQVIPEVSRMPQGMDDVAVARVTDHHVRPGMEFEFMKLIGTIAKAMADSEGAGPLFWDRSLTGAGGVYTMIEMLPDWASLAPPEKPMLQRLTEKLGAMETAKMVETYSKCVERTERQLVTYRRDLSYHPQQP